MTLTSEKYKRFIDRNNKMSKEEQIIDAGKLLSEIDLVDVDGAYRTVEKKISSKGRFLRLYTKISRYAAILVIPLIFISIWSLRGTDIQPTIQEITCPYGMRSKITLPDESEVWLNAGSTIKYSIPFVRKSRKVELSGQAFLHVVKNKKSPFSIQSGNVKVNVTGTQFDFKSYPEDDEVEVTLKEGSINLNLLSGSIETSGTEMRSGDHFVFNKKTKKAYVTNRDISRFIGWKDNTLIFNETPMFEMKKILERWYGVDIVIADKVVNSYKFTTTFKNESLTNVLELLELSSPIKINYFPAKIDKENNKTIKSKIVISKKT